MRLEKVKQESPPYPKKRVKKIVNGPSKRRKTLQLSDFEEYEEVSEDKPMR